MTDPATSRPRSTQRGGHPAGTAPGRPPWPLGAGGRPRIKVGGAPETIRVLTDAIDSRVLPDTYVRDGAPVVIESVSGAANPTAGDDDVALPLAATDLRPPMLAALLARHTDVIRARVDDKGNVSDEEISPSTSVLSAVLSGRGWPGLPVLARIISTPVLRPDGTLLQTEGYDPATGFYLGTPTPMEPIPDRPDADAVATSRQFLLQRFLRDFPWRSDADRANYLALLVSPILRPYTRALSPFGVIDATMPGSGKTILAGCVGLLVGQRVLTWTDSDEELRKAITTVLCDQVGVVVFDNLAEGAVISSPVLARLVTERTWSDRRLGANTSITVPNDRLWLATGNNLRTGGDMASRSVWVRLDPNCPRPEARTGFTIPNLDSWILDRDNQAIVLRHVLTLVLDWTAHGAPISTRVPQMRQFTRWAQHLGGFLEHHQVPGFLANNDTSRELDDDAAEWRSFLTQWLEQFGGQRMTALELRRTAEPGMPGRDPWMGTFPPGRNGQPPNVKSLGHKLTGQLDRWRTDVVLRSVADDHGHPRVYWVERAAGGTS